MCSQIQANRLKSFKEQGGRCCYCGVRMWLGSPSELQVQLPSAEAARHLRCTAEHLRARSEGGRDVPANIAAACAHCNHTRHRKKEPPDADAFTKMVRRRVAARRWHQSWVYEQGLVKLDCAAD